MTEMLDISSLRVHASNRSGVTPILEGVDLSVHEGEILGVVGETGSGKSLTALSILGLVSDPIEVAGGSIMFDGHDLAALPERRLRDYRGNRVAMIFQDPGTALNPFMRIGAQIAEAICAVQNVSRREARARVPDLLKQVGMTHPALRARQYAHQLSGGMRQRAMIAMALGNRPDLLIADEPTTGLDVTVQAQILELLRDLNRTHGMSMIVITHDLAVVAGLCDRTVVMYAGQVIEAGPTEDLFASPKHPYTQMLLHAVPVIEAQPRRLANIPGVPPHSSTMPTGCRFHPRCPIAQADCTTQVPVLEPSTPERSHRCHHPIDGDDPSFHSVTETVATGTARDDSARNSATPTVLVEADGLSKFYSSDRSGKKGLLAVDHVSFHILAGESLGLVGESGSGKSTLGRMIAQLEPITSGTVRFDGVDLGELEPRELASQRRQIQFVFQDPFSSLNPRQTVEAIITEPLRNFSMGDRQGRRETVRTMLDAVGLSRKLQGRYPHELSGGQRQRVGIARALVLRPRLLVLDEPLSSLDVSVQAQIMNLLEDLQREFDLTYLFISHDLGVVHHLCDRILVLYVGKLVEAGGRDELFHDALHPYTASLLSAVPVADTVLERRRRPILLRGEAGDGADHDACQFEPRCPVAQPECRTTEPPFEDKRPGHAAACHFPGSLHAAPSP